MRRARSFARRSSAVLLLLLLFWTASQLAARLPWIGALGTSVHTLGLGDYSADSMTSLAPLSMELLDKSRADAVIPSAVAPISSTPTPAPITTLRPTPTASPTPTSVPTPTPTSLPIPTPTP